MFIVQKRNAEKYETKEEYENQVQTCFGLFFCAYMYPE